MEKNYKSFLQLIEQRETEFKIEQERFEQEKQIFVKKTWPIFISEYIPFLIRYYSKKYAQDEVTLEKCFIEGVFYDIISVKRDDNIEDYYIKDGSFFVPSKYFVAFIARINEFEFDYNLRHKTGSHQKELEHQYKDGIYLKNLIDGYYQEMRQIKNNTLDIKIPDFYEEYRLFQIDYKYEISQLFYDYFLEKLIPLMFQNYDPSQAACIGYITCNPNYDKNLKNIVYINCENTILARLSWIIEEFNRDYMINHYLTEDEECTEFIDKSTIKVTFDNARLLHDAYTVEFFARRYKENLQTYDDPFVGIKIKHVR